MSDSKPLCGSVNDRDHICTRKVNHSNAHRDGDGHIWPRGRHGTIIDNESRLRNGIGTLAILIAMIVVLVISIVAVVASIPLRAHSNSVRSDVQLGSGIVEYDREPKVVPLPPAVAVKRKSRSKAFGLVPVPTTRVAVAPVEEVVIPLVQATPTEVPDEVPVASPTESASESPTEARTPEVVPTPSESPTERREKRCHSHR